VIKDQQLLTIVIENEQRLTMMHKDEQGVTSRIHGVKSMIHTDEQGDEPGKAWATT